MSNIKYSWIIWYRALRLFFVMFVVGFVLAVPGIIINSGTLGGLAGLFMGVSACALIACGMYTIENRPPWDELTDKTARMKLTRADRKELKTQRSQIALKAKIQELERINDIKDSEF